MDSTHWQRIPRPAEGESVTFELTTHMHIQVDGESKRITIQESGFAICIENQLYAYRNHCPHVGSPLDWTPNQFFSDDKKELICHTHGARFAPQTGDCIAGPCTRGLYPLPIQEHDTTIDVPHEFTI